MTPVADDGREHVPERPSWDCAACQKLWPCDPAREALAHEYHGQVVALSVYLWQCMCEAAVDGVGGTTREFIDRFVGWSRPLHQ